MRLKRLWHPAILGCGMSLWVFSVCPSASSAPPPTINQKIVSFCKNHQGKKVGDGDCWDFANSALVQAGAARKFPNHPDKGDYVWGKLIYYLERDPSGNKSSGKSQSILPGDIIQFRNTRFKKKTGKWYSFGHHTAVVIAAEKNGSELKLLHQNFSGNKFVTELTLQPQTLQKGWIRVYRPQPAARKKK